MDSFDFSEGTEFFSDGSFVGSERHAEDADDFGGGIVFGVFRGEGGFGRRNKKMFSFLNNIYDFEPTQTLASLLGDLLDLLGDLSRLSGVLDRLLVRLLDRLLE